MTKVVRTIPIAQIILDEEIYPRTGVNPRRVSMFAENMRDGFKVDPIDVMGDVLNLLTYWKWGLDLGQIGCDLKREALKFLNKKLWVRD